jgi:hypothetical protein
MQLGANEFRESDATVVQILPQRTIFCYQELICFLLLLKNDRDENYFAMFDGNQTDFLLGVN